MSLKIRLDALIDLVTIPILVIIIIPIIIFENLYEIITGKEYCEEEE